MSELFCRNIHRRGKLIFIARKSKYGVNRYMRRSDISNPFNNRDMDKDIISKFLRPFILFVFINKSIRGNYFISKYSQYGNGLTY